MVPLYCPDSTLESFPLSLPEPPSPGELVQLLFTKGGSALAFTVREIQPGLMAVAVGDDAWLGYVRPLDEARLLLVHRYGLIVFDRDEVELLQLIK